MVGARAEATAIARIMAVRSTFPVRKPPRAELTSKVAELSQLLPTGTVTLELIAAQFNLHTRALQRRLSDEGLRFGALLDGVRRDAAARYLRGTGITLSHLARELGYAEQSLLTDLAGDGSEVVPPPTATPCALTIRSIVSSRAALRCDRFVNPAPQPTAGGFEPTLPRAR